MSNRLKQINESWEGPSGAVEFASYRTNGGVYRILVTELTEGIVYISRQLIAEILRYSPDSVINMGDGSFYVGRILFEIIFPVPEIYSQSDCFLVNVSWSKNPLWTSQ